MNNKSLSDVIILTKNGSALVPIYNQNDIMAFGVVCALIGVPINLIMSCTILRLKRFHSKPRNIFLLSVFLSNLFAFIPSIVDIVYQFWPSDLTCRFSVSVTGLPDACLLLNLFLSLLDRYVAIRHPLWHRSKVTVPRVVLGLTLGFVLNIGINKFPYITHLIPLRCEIRLLERRIMTIYLTILFTLCLVARIMVYLQTRRILQGSIKIEEECHAEEGDLNHRLARIKLGWVPPQTIHRLEMESTKTLAAGVTSLLLISFPLVAFFLLMSFCHSWFHPANFHYCRRFTWLGPYVKQASQIHGIYHPIVYMSWNPEFSTLIRFTFRRPSTQSN